VSVFERSLTFSLLFWAPSKKGELLLRSQQAKSGGPMTTGDILDVFTVLVAGLIAISLCVLGGYVVKYREFEFNRMWRTRLLMVFLVLFFTLSLALTCLNWFPRRFASDHVRWVACGASFWAAQCCFLPLFLAIVMGLIRSLADSSALLSTHPNRGVLKRAFLYSGGVFVLGFVNVLLPISNVRAGFFSPYFDEREICVQSSYVSVLLMIYTIVIFSYALSAAGLCCSRNDAARPRLNLVHMKRIKRLAFFMVPFIILEVLSIAFPHLPGTAMLVLRYIVYVGLLACLFVYLYYFVIAPLRESAVIVLLRGNLTMRHGRFIGPPDGDEEPQAEPEQRTSDEEQV
jgi:hypothetical protein